MPSSVHNALFNPALGIDELLPAPEADLLPQAKDLAASILRESTLETLYGPVNSRTAFERLLCPELGDGRTVTPEGFCEDLASLAEKLRKRADTSPEAAALLKEDLEPLQVNGLLLTAYRNLMVGG